MKHKILIPIIFILLSVSIIATSGDTLLEATNKLNLYKNNLTLDYGYNIVRIVCSLNLDATTNKCYVCYELTSKDLNGLDGKLNCVKINLNDKINEIDIKIRRDIDNRKPIPVFMFEK